MESCKRCVSFILFLLASLKLPKQGGEEVVDFFFFFNDFGNCSQIGEKRGREGYEIARASSDALWLQLVSY